MAANRKRKLISKITENAWMNILPVFLLYLVDKYNCDENDIIQFMDWFNKMNEWIDGDEKKLLDIAKEIEQSTGVVLKW